MPKDEISSFYYLGKNKLLYISPTGSYECLDSPESEEEEEETLLRPLDPQVEGGGEGNERLCGDGYHYDYEESVCRDTDECQEEEEEVCGENAVCVNKEPGIWGIFFL